MKHRDAAIGEAGLALRRVAHLTVGKTEVAARMVGRVIHQHQVGQPRQRLAQPVEVEIGPHVSVHHHEGLVPQLRQGPEDAAAGFQRFAFGGIANGQAKARTVAQVVLDLLAEPGVIDHQLTEARLGQGAEVEFDQRRVPGADQGLGGMQGQGTHTLALAGGENHGLHGRPALSRGRLASKSPSSASSGRRSITASI
ncbi:hypothetical protein D3C78_1338500 [compost metagenome]